MHERHTHTSDQIVTEVAAGMESTFTNSEMRAIVLNAQTLLRIALTGNHNSREITVHVSDEELEKVRKMARNMLREAARTTPTPISDLIRTTIKQ